MISKQRYWFLVLLSALVYVAGMFVTLFENDSAQFAVMAMRMVQENDFLNLFKGPEEYLDKPHLHYWLAAISFKIFGLHDWAYRIPGILATLLGAYSTYGLGNQLYNKDTGRVAALIFMTAQTIVLGAIDVRTDAVLTGCTIFSIWQLTRYVQRETLQSLILGALGAGLAFSTKGQIALLVIGLPLLCYIAYSHKWRVLLNYRILIGLAVFALTISPMLYAYYHQFDMHPEKVIRGRNNRSGIFFIFWEQSFERLSGEGVGKNSSDYFFFFHTFLWVFLPWTIIGIAAYWTRMKRFIKTRFAYDKNVELLTVGGITLIFIIISFAQFKLPHYLNVTIPLWAVLSAGYLHTLYITGRQKVLQWLLVGQYIILGVVVVASLLLCFYVFEVNSWVIAVFLVIPFLITVYYLLQADSKYARLVTITVCTAVILNTVLNLHFYPHLLKYQGGSAMAEIIKEQKIPVEKIYKIMPEYTWSLDFYDKCPVKLTTLEQLSSMKNVWLYVKDGELKDLKKSGLDWDRQYTVDQFRITRLQAKFLNPETRNMVTEKMHLVHVR